MRKETTHCFISAVQITALKDIIEGIRLDEDEFHALTLNSLLDKDLVRVKCNQVKMTSFGNQFIKNFKLIGE